MSSDPSFADRTPIPSSADRRSFGPEPVDYDAGPVVSIVTPFYNTSTVFREAAASVHRQTMQQWEWIIVNDGSTDVDALAELETYRGGDPRIQVIDHDENRGPATARNTGYGAATTDFVVQLDADDQLEPTMLEKLFWYLQSNPRYSFAKGYTVGFGAESYVWVNGFHPNELFLESNHADVLAMVRKDVHAAVGGYDETNRDGLEDWEFWIRCASHGFWGGTVHEPLAWYRRRSAHGDRWGNWDGGVREEAFRAEMEKAYPALWQGEFPHVEPRVEIPYEAIDDSLPLSNELKKTQPRILLILPWMTMGGADRFNLDAVELLTEQGWDVTIATTVEGDQSWEREFRRFTSDIFVLDRFLRPVDYPRFLRYLIGSRSSDVVLVSNSELGYQLLPYLRAHHPQTTFMDLSHAEQEDWKDGGHPNFSNIYRDQLDLSLVVSDHLRSWMIGRGGDGSRIEVCHLGVDTDEWKANESVRSRMRSEIGVPDEVPVILYAGRLAEEKQPKVFAETMLSLRDANIDFMAVVAGGGEDRMWLEEFIAKNCLDTHVSMLGAVPSERMRDLLCGADVFFLPSKREGIALSLFEAMACGVPVVAARVGGQAELVTGDTGVLVERSTPDGEVRAYSDAVRSLLDDPDRLADLARNARSRVVEEFSLGAMADRLAALIARARELHDKSPRSTVPIESAVASATLAVEYHRVSRIGEGQWGDDAGDAAPMHPATSDGSPATQVSVGKRAYRFLSVVLSRPYRYLKARYPDQTVAARNRARSLLGPRR